MINSNLESVINDYLADVEIGINLFKKLIGDKHPLRAWGQGELNAKGKLSDDIEYEFHGIGCFLIFTDRDVDFDFGPDQRSDGFDFWRLKGYVDSQSDRYPEYSKGDKLKIDFENAVKNGDVRKLNRPYTNLYYLSSSID